MFYKNQDGSTSVAVAIIATLLFVLAGIFGVWAFSNMQDYKNNADQKAAAAVVAAEKAQEQKLKQQFEEESKNPTKTYKSSTVTGSLVFKYPKTWNAYFDTSDQSRPVNGYFSVGPVPSIQSGTAYALRVEVLNSNYADVIKQINAEASQNKPRARAFVPVLMKNKENVETGTRFDGDIGVVAGVQGPITQQGAKVIIAVRDKTLVLTTQSQNYLNDFNKIVLPSLTFSP